MSNRKQIEKKEHWQATFRRLRRDETTGYECLMATVSGGFFWETPDYDGLFSWGATRDFNLEETAKEIEQGAIKLVKGKLPDWVKSK